MSEQTTLVRPRFGIAPLLAALVHRPQRASLLPALGALIGLIVAGTTTFRGVDKVATVVPPGYVALVNQKGILMSDFVTQTAEETGTDFANTTQAERSKVLREMIDEELRVQRGLMLDLPETTTEVRGTMADAVNSQAAQPVLAQAPTDAELRAYYTAHRSNYATTGSMTVHDLLLRIGGYQNADQSTAQAQTDATEAVYQLRSGASIDYVKEHFGFVDSGRIGGDEELDFAAKLHMGAKLFQVAASLSTGQISDPVVDFDGVHVLVMELRVPPRVADFSQVRDRVYADYKDARIKQADQKNIEFLRRDAHILLAPGERE
jgi:parvulin-like peptidyl-prolyl isomerase